ncbi:protein phosphatase 2C domain-containing protein [Synechococcus sp. CS-205]|uniref:protein phosphatase 2C domain-containing protein n=1 Tax=Synechococcus sp. CS-205 TaxID=2847984 RepID=UPI00223AF8CF|nr:protein phosphatase 2C domain-containing protein [Synechococcus sp. CS-205]MCT0249411.1 protein phosphatase 2C domain-containing protein [Synechococcus sp. CS-205]
MTGWRPPLRARHIGAAHQRQGRPCQDAVASAQCHSRDHQPVQVMALADGHGGERYPYSDVGSTLACEQALLAVEEHLRECALLGAQAPRANEWARWLEAELPQRIHSRWLAEVLDHWQRQAALAPAQTAAAEAQGSEDQVPLSYGTTLGLVVMAPGWWGYTGLGDWDLVQVGPGGEAVLLSEEAPQEGGGEATGSLCLEQAPRMFRSGLKPIEHRGAAFGLLLSTDGIRKSCATDTDFLALAAHLIATPGTGASDALAANLEQITSEGSGDDVSVAMALHGTLESTQPVPAQVAALHRKAGDDQPRGAAAHSGATARLEALRSHPGPALAAVALLVVAAGLGSRWLWVKPRSHAPQPVATAVRRQINQLCRGPSAAIAGTLSSRRSQFTGLREGHLRALSLLDASNQDPLGALIASSFDPATGGLVQGEALRALNLCPPLEAALQLQWQPKTIPALPAR